MSFGAKVFGDSVLGAYPLSTPHAVNSSLTCTWGYEGNFVVQALNVYWDSTTNVSTNLSINWGVEQYVTAPLTTNWDTQAYVDNPLLVSWNIESKVSNDLDILWSAEEGVGASLTCAWNILDSNVVNCLNVYWNIRDTIETDYPITITHGYKVKPRIRVKTLACTNQSIKLNVIPNNLSCNKEK